VRPSPEEIAAARGARKRALLCFQGSILWMAGAVGVISVAIVRGIELPRLALAGLLAIGIVLGLLAGRRHRLHYVYLAVGTAMPAALMPPILIASLTCVGTVVLGYVGHLVASLIEGRDPTAPPPRDADAPSEVVRAQAERSIPGRENIKAVPNAPLLPKFGRRYR
jgi:hypothetical protein